MSVELNSPEAISIVSPSTDREWRHVEVLMDELKAWDVRQSETLGFVRDEVIELFYPEDIEEVRRHSAAPDGCLLLAMEAAVPVGCAAFRRLTSEACEAYNVYVRPAHRGRRIASRLLQRLQRAAKTAGYRAMRLETAIFMRDAHRLYRSLHFQVRAAYRSVPDSFAGATLWRTAAAFAPHCRGSRCMSAPQPQRIGGEAIDAQPGARCASSANRCSSPRRCRNTDPSGFGPSPRRLWRQGRCWCCAPPDR